MKFIRMPLIHRNHANRLKKTEIIENVLKKRSICAIINNDILCGGKDHESKL